MVLGAHAKAGAGTGITGHGSPSKRNREMDQYHQALGVTKQSPGRNALAQFAPQKRDGYGGFNLASDNVRGNGDPRGD